MQAVSEAWKAAHEKRLLEQNLLEITIEIGDPESMSDAKASDNGASDLANTEQITYGIDLGTPRYGTLELNQTMLDGSSVIVPDTHPEDTGFISDDLSDADGYFASPPQITISFSRVFEKLIPGITVSWAGEYGEFARDYAVTAYNGGTVVSETSVVDNTSITAPIEIDIVNYDRIVLTVTRWCLPYHRARVGELFVGLKKSYKNADIFDYNNSVRIYPLSEKLPKYEIKFEVSNIDGTYDPDSPEGLTKYLIRRQSVNVRYGMKVNGKPEWISGGKYYLNEWKSPQNGIEATFKARGLLEYLSDEYIRGTYAPNGETLLSLAEGLMRELNLPKLRDGTDPWEFDASLGSMTTKAALPIGTYAECLQLIANAAGCTLSMRRDGKVIIAPMHTEQTDYVVKSFNSFEKPETDLSKQLKNIKVDVYSYYNGDAVELFNGIVPVSGTQTVPLRYSDAATGVSATVTGGTLVSAKYYTNACELTITGSGDVTVVLNGTQLKESSSVYTEAVGDDGDDEELDNPMITSSELAHRAADVMRAVLTNRRQFDLDWRPDTRLDAGDIITVSGKYSDTPAQVTELEYSFNGAYHATAKTRATE